jgi:NADH-quinone oxidoreductase subunit J
MGSTTSIVLPTLAIMFGAIGTYLLLPLRHGDVRPGKVHLIGAGLTALGFLGLLLGLLSPPGPFLSGFFFLAFSILAVLGAVLTISSRSPIDSALWFASVILSTTGLFLLAGAPFLAAGTVIVYAGAIIVTFLFVIMLAQMEGKTAYDRSARSPGTSTFTCFLVFWCLVFSLLSFRTDYTANGQKVLLPPREITIFYPVQPKFPLALVLSAANRATSEFLDADGKPKPHVAGLGETLYTDHLITVELVGALLFVALVGAVAIINPKMPIRPGDRRGVSTAGTNA